MEQLQDIKSLKNRKSEIEDLVNAKDYDGIIKLMNVLVQQGYIAGANGLLLVDAIPNLTTTGIVAAKSICFAKDKGLC